MRLQNVSRAATLAALAVATILAPLSLTAHADATSTPNGKIYYGKYFIHNNIWGQGNGWQSIWNWNSGTNVGWGCNWNWTGDANTVKGYPSVVLGWHWGDWSNNSGLPARIWDNKSVNTGWNYTVTGNSRLNVSYDLWFHTMSNPTWQNNPSDELMVWTYKNGSIYPVGSYQQDVSIAGVNYELWKGTAGPSGSQWNVYSFIRKSNTSSVTLNLRNFINYIVYTKSWMSNAKYLTSVQAGTEVFTSVGEGKLDTSSYYCNIQ